MTKLGVHCINCMGTGTVKTHDMIGLETLKWCEECKGLGGVLAEEGDGYHRIAANIGAMKGYYDTEKRKGPSS